MHSRHIQIRIKRLPADKDLPLPEYKSEGAAAMDVHAAVRKTVTISPGGMTVIPCGFAIALPKGYEAQILPRSGLASSHGITVLNSPGTIDSDYRGEIKIILINNGQAPFSVKRGMRIAQMVVAPVSRVEWEEAEELSQTQRGEQGYGHTGE